MVIFRTKPASITFEGTVIFPGAQFFSDERFDHLKTTYPDFVVQCKGGDRAPIRVLIKPSDPVMIDDPAWKPDTKNKDAKAPKVKTWPKAKANIGEELKAVDEEAAVNVVQEIIDEEELREVQTLDTRRAVQQACVKQWAERGSAMERLAPRAITSPSRDIASKPIFSSDDPVVQDVVRDMAATR